MRRKTGQRFSSLRNSGEAPGHYPNKTGSKPQVRGIRLLAVTVVLFMIVIKHWHRQGGPETPSRKSAIITSRPFQHNLVSDIQPGYDKYFLIVSKLHNVAITLIPKVMMTSISVSIETDECKDSGRKQCRAFRMNPHLLDDVDLSRLTRVLFVRDPAERALSAYQNSDTNYVISIGPCRNTTDCTFAEWVKELKRDRPQSFENIHFKPQTDIAQLDQMNYHYVLRLSSPVDQRFFWTTLLGRDGPLRENDSSGNATIMGDPAEGNNKKTEHDHFSFFTRDIMEDLIELYAQDFKLWGQILKDGTPHLAGDEITAYDVFDVPSMMKNLSLSP